MTSSAAAPTDPLRDVAAKVAFLSTPASFGPGCRRVDLIETHMSWLFLTEQHVYKLKKPIRQDLFDFTTVAARHRNGLEEVRLNRRLAPDVYLGLKSLDYTQDRGFSLDTGEHVVDWLVQMRRLPAARMLDELLRNEELHASELAEIAAMLADFYAMAQPEPLTARHYLAQFADTIAINRTELSAAHYPFDTARIAALCDSQADFLEREQHLLEDRVHRGRIIEAHGDLRPEHICVLQPPIAIDCLEFSRQLRLLDPADELGYLGLECENIGGEAVEPALFVAYMFHCNDNPPARLVHFYKSVRATTRARLMARHLLDHPPAQWPKWIARARAYLALAERYV